MHLSLQGLQRFVTPRPPPHQARGLCRTRARGGASSARGTRGARDTAGRLKATHRRHALGGGRRRTLEHLKLVGQRSQLAAQESI